MEGSHGRGAAGRVQRSEGTLSRCCDFFEEDEPLAVSIYDVQAKLEAAMKVVGAGRNYRSCWMPNARMSVSQAASEMCAAVAAFDSQYPLQHSGPGTPHTTADQEGD